MIEANLAYLQIRTAIHVMTKCYAREEVKRGIPTSQV